MKRLMITLLVALVAVVTVSAEVPAGVKGKKLRMALVKEWGTGTHSSASAFNPLYAIIHPNNPR